MSCEQEAVRVEPRLGLRVRRCRRGSTRPARGARRTPGCSRAATRPRPGRRRTAAARAVGRRPRARVDRERTAHLEQLRAPRAGRARRRPRAPRRRHRSTTSGRAPPPCGLGHGERGADHASKGLASAARAPGSTSTLDAPRVVAALGARRREEVDRRRHARTRSAGLAVDSSLDVDRPHGQRLWGRYPRPRWAGRERRREGRARPSGASPRSTPTRCARSTSTRPVRAAGGHDPVGADAPTSG